MLLRFNGQILEEEEEEISVSDPRKNKSISVPPSLRPPRSQLILLSYPPDPISIPPSSPSPTAILITQLNPTTPTSLLKHHLSSHGHILSLERPLDPRTGGAIGLVWVNFSSPQAASSCLQKDNGRRGLGGQTDDQEWKIEFDQDGSRMKSLVDDRRTKPPSRPPNLPPKPATPHPISTGSSTTPSSNTSDTLLSSFRPTPQQHDRKGRNDAVQQSLRAARQAAAVQESDPVETTTPTVAPTVPKPKKMNFSWSTLRFAGKYTNNLALPKYSGPTRYAKDSDNEPEHDRESPSPPPLDVEKITTSQEKKLLRYHLLSELHKCGMESIILDVGENDQSVITDEEIKRFFLGFRIDKVCPIK